MSELASVSVSAFPTPEIEAGFTARPVGSGQLLQCQNGSTYISNSAMSVRKSYTWSR